MRPTPDHRALRASLALCGLACLAPATIAASAAHAAPAAVSAAPSIRASVSDRHVTWGSPVLVTGRVRGAGSGPLLALQFRPAGGDWTTVATTTAHRGTFRFRRPLPGRGAVRVTLGDGIQAAAAGIAGQAPALTTSAEHAVRVRAAILLRTRNLALQGSRRASLTGVVRPRRGGRLVVAQRRSAHGWVTAARARTDRHGRFRLAWHPKAGARIRVRASGDATVNLGERDAGRVVVLRSALASWYGDYGGALACGGRLGAGQLGVANKSLPCGTMVTIAYRGRTVRVPVIDRGPYVGGREFDLTGATARALGFDGVGVIQVSTR